MVSFDKYLSKNQCDGPTILALLEPQLNSTRLEKLHVPSTIRNWRSSATFFQQVLESFTPDDLMEDVGFNAFLDGLERCIKQSSLAPSTIENYCQVLHANLLVLGGVIERVRKEVKQGLRIIRKNLKCSKQTSRAIQDEDLVQWLCRLDWYCENAENAPNLFAIANAKSKMAYRETMTKHHLLLLRGFVWLTLATGARGGEIRSLTVDSITQTRVTRSVYKMKVVSEEIASELPEFILQRIRPMLVSVSNKSPEATLLFSESDSKKGRGTIDPRLLQELVKGSMMDSGMPPTSPGGYYRLHDLRKVWARWINENGGSIESISPFLGHSSTQVTYNAYFHDEPKQRLAIEGQRKGLNHLKSLLSPPMNDMAERLSELRKILAVGGSIYAEHSFGLRHTIKPTESASRSWSPLPDLNRGHPDVC